MNLKRAIDDGVIKSSETYTYMGDGESIPCYIFLELDGSHFRLLKASGNSDTILHGLIDDYAYIAGKIIISKNFYITALEKKIVSTVIASRQEDLSYGAETFEKQLEKTRSNLRFYVLKESTSGYIDARTKDRLLGYIQALIDTSECEWENKSYPVTVNQLYDIILEERIKGHGDSGIYICPNGMRGDTSIYPTHLDHIHVKDNKIILCPLDYGD